MLHGHGILYMHYMVFKGLHSDFGISSLNSLDSPGPEVAIPPQKLKELDGTLLASSSAFSLAETANKEFASAASVMEIPVVFFVVVSFFLLFLGVILVSFCAFALLFWFSGFVCAAG